MCGSGKLGEWYGIAIKAFIIVSVVGINAAITQRMVIMELSKIRVPIQPMLVEITPGTKTMGLFGLNGNGSLRFLRSEDVKFSHKSGVNAVKEGTQAEVAK